ncbi:MAG: acetyltransferase [Proteobacteria bacterium]|nr:acetyltransferase [Pseudomonadota bacterium]
MNIKFQPFQKEHIPLWEEWIHIPHVKDVWFIEGYETSDYIYEKIKGNGYDYPFVVFMDNNPIGYIVCCDLYAYRTICPKPKGVFTHEDSGTFGMDLFIAKEDYLNKGYGTEIVKSFVDYVFKHFKAKTLLIDPAVTNKRAIRCYEKAGFTFVKEAFDGITQCYVMKIKSAKS